MDNSHYSPGNYGPYGQRNYNQKGDQRGDTFPRQTNQYSDAPPGYRSGYSAQPPQTFSNRFQDRGSSYRHPAQPPAQSSGRNFRKPYESYESSAKNEPYKYQSDYQTFSNHQSSARQNYQEHSSNWNQSQPINPSPARQDKFNYSNNFVRSAPLQSFDSQASTQAKPQFPKHLTEAWDNFIATGGEDSFEEQSPRYFPNNQLSKPSTGFNATVPLSNAAGQWQNPHGPVKRHKGPTYQQQKPKLDDIEKPVELKWKRGTGPNVDARFLVNNRQVGAIVGKMGTNIKRLKSTYSESITVQDNDRGRLPESIFSVSADIGVVSEAIQDVLPRLKSVQDESPFSELKLLIHESQIIWVSGKNYELLHGLNESTGTIVKVYPASCPRSTDRVVSVRGTPVRVVNCVCDLLNLLDEHKPVGKVHNYQTENCDELLISGYGGYSFNNEASELDDNAGIQFIQLNQRKMSVRCSKLYDKRVFGNHCIYARELRQVTNLQVTIERPPAKSYYREFTLVGHPDQLMQARLLLQVRYMEAVRDKLLGVEPPRNPGRQRRPLDGWMTKELVAMKVHRRKLERNYMTAKQRGDKERIAKTHTELRSQTRKFANAVNKAKWAWEEERGIINPRKARKLEHDAEKAAKFAAKVAAKIAAAGENPDGNAAVAVASAEIIVEKSAPSVKIDIEESAASEHDDSDDDSEAGTEYGDGEGGPTADDHDDSKIPGDGEWSGMTGTDAQSFSAMEQDGGGEKYGM